MTFSFRFALFLRARPCVLCVRMPESFPEKTAQPVRERTLRSGSIKTGRGGKPSSCLVY